MLPTFTLDQFLEMMTRYNLTFWPLQVAAYGLGIIIVLLAVRAPRYSGKIISAILVLFWLWAGLVFNLGYFIDLYFMALSFAVLFVIEAGVLIYFGVIRGNLSFKIKADASGAAGALLVLYSLAGYPAIEYLLGRGYPELLPVGLAPCPTVVFTLGIFLWSSKKPKWYVLTVPVLYALTGLVPVSRGIVEDIGLFVSGLVTLFMVIYWYRVTKADQGGGTVYAN